MTDWLAALFAAALALVAGSLLFHTAVLLPAIGRALDAEDALTARFAAGAWALPVTRTCAVAALLLSALRIPGPGSWVSFALSGLSGALVFAWTRVPLRRLEAMARAWMETAATPDASRLARTESLDRAMALGGAVAALLALAELLAR